VTDQPHSYLVLGRDLDPSTPWLVGDVPDVYPVLENIDEFNAEARELRANAHPSKFQFLGGPLAAAAANAKAIAAMDPHPRTVHRSRCDCSKKNPSLVKAYALDGDIWVWIRGYRIPNFAKRHTAHLGEADTAWPLHGLPHPYVTCCRKCLTYWGVLLKPTGYEFVKLGTPTFEATIRS
jgi:hypothetical protein